MSRLFSHCAVLLTVVGLVLGTATQAHATECTEAGTTVFTADEPAIESGEVDRDHPRVAVSPARTVHQVSPERAYIFSLHITNSTPASIRLSAHVIRLEAATNAASFVQPSHLALARGFTYELPTKLPLLEAGDAIDMPVRVSIASCATPGISAVGVALRQTLAPPATNTDTGPRISLGADLVAEYILQVPGETTTRLSLRNLNGPRIVWSGEHPKFSAVVQNDGSSLLELRGKVELDAFANRAARTLDTEHVLILPEGSRRITATWNDPPVVGWFHPNLRVSQDGVTETAQYARVFVLPPWWVIVAIILAVALPIWMQTHRRRRRHR